MKRVFSTILLLSCWTISSAFVPWGVPSQNRISLSVTNNVSVPHDPKNFEGIDLVRLLGYNRVQNINRRRERRQHAKSNTGGGGVKVIIAGAPASGKGTQCEFIQEKYGVIHLSTGDMLRAAVAAQTEVGKAAKNYMDSGKLVPDSVIIGVVKDRLSEDDCKKNGWLLDGFPRTPAQAQALAEAGITAECFLFLNVPDQILVERVVGRRTDPVTGKIYHLTFSPPENEEIASRLVQRSDDTEEKIKVRLEQFHANVEAVKGFYTDIMVEIDGTAKPNLVAARIEQAIASKIKV